MPCLCWNDWTMVAVSPGAQQAGVDEDAGQLVAHGAVHGGRGHGRIDTAAETQMTRRRPLAADGRRLLFDKS